MMKCPYCGKEAAREIKTIETIKNPDTGEYFLVDNVPLVTCKNCGEASFSAEVIKKIENIRKFPEKAEEKLIRVATF